MGKHNKGFMSKIMDSLEGKGNKHHKKKIKKKSIKGCMDEILSELDDVIDSFKKLKHKFH